MNNATTRTNVPSEEPTEANSLSFLLSSTIRLWVLSQTSDLAEQQQDN